MTFDITLEVRCEGKYVSARPSRYDAWFGNWMPGEPAHVDNFKVYIGDTDITAQLTEKQISELEADYLITIEESDEVA